MKVEWKKPLEVRLITRKFTQPVKRKWLNRDTTKRLGDNGSNVNFVPDVLLVTKAVGFAGNLFDFRCPEAKMERKRNFGPVWDNEMNGRAGSIKWDHVKAAENFMKAPFWQSNFDKNWLVEKSCAVPWC